MKKSFMEQFYAKAEKAKKTASESYKSADYLGFIEANIESVYYQALGFAVNGCDHSGRTNTDGKLVTVVDELRRQLLTRDAERARMFQALKKIGKEDKARDVDAVINGFIEAAAPDFLSLSGKSTEVCQKLMSMNFFEKQAKNLLNNKENDISPEDRLMMEDEMFMATMNRRKAQGNVSRLAKAVLEVLK
jgi:hypothetical protein